jgi:uncharacterized membrane protein
MAEGRKDMAEVVRRGRPRHREEWGIEFSRIVAFSDSVFAIAITLLVLQIDLPRHVPPGSTLLDEILAQDGDFIAYAISFAVLGKLWLAHHRFFSAVERFDGLLMGLNLLYLAWIVLVPFTSEVLGDYGDNSTGVILYAISLVGVGLTFQAQIVHATRRDLVRPELRDMEQRYAAPGNLVMVSVFLLSIPVALISPLAAILMWPAVFLTGRRVGAWLGELRA